jgi:hypothetical protein
MQALKALVIGMGVLIVAGTVTLVVLIIQRAGPTGRAADVALELPAGNRIMGIAGMERRLAVWVEGPEGARVLLLDPETGRRVGEIRTR